MSIIYTQLKKSKLFLKMCIYSYCIIKMMLWDAYHVYLHLTDKEMKTNKENLTGMELFYKV